MCLLTGSEAFWMYLMSSKPRCATCAEGCASGVTIGVDLTVDWSSRYHPGVFGAQDLVDFSSDDTAITRNYAAKTDPRYIFEKHG
jgi:hypothetical protein